MSGFSKRGVEFRDRRRRYLTWLTWKSIRKLSLTLKYEWALVTLREEGGVGMGDGGSKRK